ncbi:hypothetical protein GCM10018793_03850 [Streptomyces sulfonofaciens]|uniref:Uncharacterized protein n=1 Tax=Streptomyces sulfonofaciens TaxID=68272 RepID=A0A919FQ55_9ACTN|nr:hypothetical protein [Streptomyces sulfonofaciens]GHH70193.1 hypothetical protein GCM10018793_03850 [Streptomyces sulfonofaciens]
MSTPPPQGQNPYAQAPNAYGQQPPPPQGGYGYPPQQGQQPGMPPGPSPYINQGAPLPPAPPRRSRKSVLRIAGFAVVAVVAIGGWYASRDDAKTASVGDCMHRGSTNDTNPDLEVVDCNDAKAQYKVLAKIDGTFTSTEADAKCVAAAKDFQYAYTETGGGNSFLLCLKDYK